MNSQENIAMTTKQAAIYIGVSVAWLRMTRCKGKKYIESGKKRNSCPPYYKMSDRKVIYKQFDLDNWMQQFKVNP